MDENGKGTEGERSKGVMRTFNEHVEECRRIIATNLDRAKPVFDMKVGDKGYMLYWDIKDSPDGKVINAMSPVYSLPCRDERVAVLIERKKDGLFIDGGLRVGLTFTWYTDDANPLAYEVREQLGKLGFSSNASGEVWYAFNPEIY